MGLFRSITPIKRVAARRLCSSSALSAKRLAGLAHLDAHVFADVLKLHHRLLQADRAVRVAVKHQPVWRRLLALPEAARTNLAAVAALGYGCVEHSGRLSSPLAMERSAGISLAACRS